jgi:hypothetical protein
MGHVNIIWQGDANEMAIRCLLHCTVPARILNIAGADTASVRDLALKFGELFEKKPTFVHTEQDTALLSNASESYRLFGAPQVSLAQMIELIAQWIERGGKVLNKPTHFQEREGHF